MEEVGERITWGLEGEKEKNSNSIWIENIF